MKHNYNDLAVAWAEKYGIVEYKVKAGKMIYYKNYYDDCFYKRYTTYKVIVDLKSGLEKRIALKRCNKIGWYNV